MPTDTFNISTDAADGACRYISTEGWANVLLGNGDVDNTFEDRSGLTTCVVVKSVSAGSYFLANVFFRFDTSALPDDATITGAVLKVYVDSLSDTADDVEYAADFYDWGGTPATSADWENVSSGNAISSIDPDSLTTSAVNNLTLTGLSGISLNGTTGIRIAPLNTDAPTGDNFVRFAANEHASGAPAALEVTYTTAAAFTPRMMLLGAG